MTGQIKILKPHDLLELRQTEPIHDDLKRLARSMANVLRRRYPNVEERRVITSRIMQELNNNSLAVNSAIA
jgi:hypothetical protein